MASTLLDPIYMDNLPQEENPNAVSLPAQGVPEDNAVSLPTPNQSQLPLQPPVAQQKAIKTEQGLGKVLNKTADDLYPDYLAGNEDLIRTQAASTLNYQNDMKKQQMIKDLSQKYGPLNSQEVMKILDPFAPQNAGVDPDSVVEKAFSSSYVSYLHNVPAFMSDKNVMDNAAIEIPEQAKQVEDTGDDLLSKNQYLLKKIQDVQNQTSNQSWGGYLVDMAKGATQLYPEIKQRGMVDGIYGVGALGSNLEEQSNALYAKQFPDFKANVDKIAEMAKDNPQQALSALQAMYGQDTFEKVLNNTFTALAIPDMALGAKVIKKVLSYNQINKAAKDIVTAAARDPEATVANKVAGAGDVAESAVVQVADGVVKAIQGTSEPLKAARTTLLTTWKDDAEKFAANQGTYLSREQYTRLQDGFMEDGTDLLNRIETMNRVERNPNAVAEDVVRAYKDHISNDPKYRGNGATVLDVDGPFIEPASNTKWYRMHLGNYNAELLSSQETAEGLQSQLGGIGTVKQMASDNVARDFEQDMARFEDEGGFIPREPDYTRKRIEDITKQLAGKASKEYKAILKKELKALESGKAEAVRPPDLPIVKQQGIGFYIEHWIPMQETDPFLRDLMIKNVKGEIIPEAVSMSSESGTKSIINSILGWVRNSEDTLSINESAQRKAVTYTQSNIHKWAYGLSKEIDNLKGKGDWWKPTAYLGKLPGRQVVQDFERTLVHSRNEEKWFENPGQLQDFYLRNFQRDPSFLETKAYFNYVKLTEGDRMFGEIAEFRNRARLGAEQHQLKFLGPDGKPIYSDIFDGVTLKRFPSIGADQILLSGKDNGTQQVKELQALNSVDLKELRRKVEAGQGKIVEIYDIDHQPLSGLSDVTKDQRIRYVYSETIDSKPLAFNHVNRKEGGHFEWDYDHYIKQADMRRQASGKHIYVGDTTVMPIGNRSLGANVIKLWNEAQELIKEGKWEEVRPIAAKLGIEYKQFTGWYKAGRDDLGKAIGPKLNANEPMYVVQKGKNILSIDDSLQMRYRFKDKLGNPVNRFEDGTKTGMANNFKVAYNTERHSDFNFKTINDIGSKDNPIYAHQPAKLIDPLTTMNRAFNRAINSSFMDDYKMYSIEHWLREAETHLEAKGGIDEIRSAPFKWFNDPKYKSSTPANIKWNLESHRYKVSTFIGVPSKFDTWVHTFTEHLADQAYSKYGPEEGRNFFDKAKSIPPIWMLHHLKNPVDFIRGATFNFKLGFFNPAQFLVQAQTHSLIWALEPKHGTVGTFGMLLHGWSAVNSKPAIMEALDKYYTKLNMFGSKAKPGEFMEAHRELEKTGFANVAGEHGNISKSYTPTTNFLMGDIAKGLRLGQTPFRLGEQSTRVTAWYTAFRKFREENPFTPITNIERSKILNHADLLTVNMSRASSSAINHGVFSLSTQFLSYQIKLAELFWSKRIGETATDRMLARARMVTGFAALYGMPNAVGVTGAPVADWARQHLYDDLGYIPGEKWWSTMINEGFPAWSLAMITGKGDLQAGNVENVGNRFGSQGWQNIRDYMRSSVPWWQAIGGAGVSTASNFISASLDPFYQGALSWAHGDTGDQRFTIKSADLVEPLKQISTISIGAKWWAAIQTGKLINNNEGYVTDISPLRATYLSILGMKPQAEDDAFINNQIIKGEKEAQVAAQKEAIKDWHRGLEAFQNGDPNQGNAYINNAMARLAVVGTPPAEVLKFMSTANKGWESAIDASDYSFWTRGDSNKQQQRLEQYQRKLQLKDKRAQ